MRVLVVTAGMGLPGGIALYNRHLVEAFSEFADVDVVDKSAMQSASKFICNFRLLLFLVRSIGGSRFDHIVLCHMNFLFTTAAIYLTFKQFKKLRSHFWVWGYGIDIWKKPAVHTAIMARVLKADLVVGSHYSKQRIEHWSSSIFNRVFVVQNAVDCDFLSPKKRTRKLDNPRDPLRLVTIGRQWSSEAYKGVDTLLEAMAILTREQDFFVKLEVIGSGDDLERLRSLSRELELSPDAVVFHGHVSDSTKFDILKRSDILVQVGWGEGFGYVVIEGLACGLRVIVSSQDGSQEAGSCCGGMGLAIEPKLPREIVAAVNMQVANTIFDDDSAEKIRLLNERLWSLKRFKTGLFELFK